MQTHLSTAEHVSEATPTGPSGGPVPAGRRGGAGSIRLRSGLAPVVLQIACVALLFGLHHVSALLQLGPSYTPFSAGSQISAQTWDETQFYAPGPQRVLRTGQVHAELDVWELRDVPNGQPLLPTVVLGLAARAAGSLESVWILADAIFPALIWLLFFALARARTGSFGLSSLVAWSSVLIPFAPRNMMLLGPHALDQPLELTRMPHPAFSFLLLLIGAVAMARAWKSGTHWRAALAGALLGVLFYTYYFYWVGALLALGAVGGWSLVLRQRQLAVRTTLAAACMLLVGSPYLWTVAAAQATQLSVMGRHGSFDSPLSVRSVLAAVLGIVLLGLVQHRMGRSADRAAAAWQPFALLALAAGGALGLNLHLVTGYDPLHWYHFTNRLIQPLVWFLLATELARWAATVLPAVPRRALVTTGLTLCLGLGAFRQLSSAALTLEDHDASHGRSAVAAWIRGNLPPDAVIATTDPSLMALVPAVAGTWSFVPLGFRTSAQNTEILRRYLVAAGLEGSSWEDVSRELGRQEGAERPWLYTWNVLKIGDPAVIVPEARELWNRPGAGEPGERRLDYFVTPAYRRLVLSNRLRPVHEQAGWIIARYTGAP